MLTFKKVELEDSETLRAALLKYDKRVCDYSAGNIIFWRDYYGISYCLDDDGLVLKYDSVDLKRCYSFPVSDEPIRLIEKILKASKSDVCLTCLTEEQLLIVKNSFNVVDVIHTEDFDDYLYLAKEMVELAGRRYCGQRNHINKFKKLYADFCFEEITKDNAAQAKEFCHRYFNGIGKNTAVSDVEYKQLVEQFDNWEGYNQLGGMLKVDGTVIGISVGEIVGDTLIVHTEKADTSYQGAYPMLTNLFAKTFVNEQCRFINREEDCGEEGLRISKRSYHPIEMLKKYAVIIK